MKSVTFTTTNVSGRTRAYYATIDWRMPLPNLSDIMENPDSFIGLMCHIASNHKGLNWKIYKFQFSRETYPVFLYSLAFCAMNTRPTVAYSWQISANARQIEKYLIKNNISLSDDLNSFLAICKDFTNWDDLALTRIHYLSLIIDSIANSYL